MAMERKMVSTLGVLSEDSSVFFNVSRRPMISSGLALPFNRLRTDCAAS